MLGRRSCSTGLLEMVQAAGAADARPLGSVEPGHNPLDLACMVDSVYSRVDWSMHHSLAASAPFASPARSVQGSRPRDADQCRADAGGLESVYTALSSLGFHQDSRLGASSLMPPVTSPGHPGSTTTTTEGSAPASPATMAASGGARHRDAAAVLPAVMGSGLDTQCGSQGHAQPAALAGEHNGEAMAAALSALIEMQNQGLDLQNIQDLLNCLRDIHSQGDKGGQASVDEQLRQAMMHTPSAGAALSHLEGPCAEAPLHGLHDHSHNTPRGRMPAGPYPRMHAHASLDPSPAASLHRARSCHAPLPPLHSPADAHYAASYLSPPRRAMQSSTMLYGADMSPVSPEPLAALPYGPPRGTPPLGDRARGQPDHAPPLTPLDTRPVSRKLSVSFQPSLLGRSRTASSPDVHATPSGLSSGTGVFIPGLHSQPMSSAASPASAMRATPHRHTRSAGGELGRRGAWEQHGGQSDDELRSGRRSPAPRFGSQNGLASWHATPVQQGRSCGSSREPSVAAPCRSLSYHNLVDSRASAPGQVAEAPSCAKSPSRRRKRSGRTRCAGALAAQDGSSQVAGTVDTAAADGTCTALSGPSTLSDAAAPARCGSVVDSPQQGAERKPFAALGPPACPSSARGRSHTGGLDLQRLASTSDCIPLAVSSWTQDQHSVTVFLQLEAFNPASLMVQIQQHMVVVMAMNSGGPNHVFMMRPEHAVRVQGSKSRPQPGSGIHIVLQKRSPGFRWASFGSLATP